MTRKRRRRFALGAAFVAVYLRSRLGSWWAVLACVIAVFVAYGLLRSARYAWWKGALAFRSGRRSQYTAVYIYRHWWSRAALYVGITNSPTRRHAQHKLGRRPFVRLGTYRRLRWYATRREALDVEAALTACRDCGGLEPRYNIENACWHDGHYNSASGRRVRRARIAESIGAAA